MQGIYAMYFTGSSGSGHAVFVMKDGVVAGADAIGGLVDGDYSVVDGEVQFAIRLTVSPGTTLVTGAVAGQDSMVQQIDATLPANFANGDAHQVKTPTGPVNVIFRRLRDTL